MIPKIIHYVWLGHKPKPKKIKKCIKSWKKFCPDFQILEWNESNFDITSNKFVKDAYCDGKYAFASDVIRLEILYKFGGIYVDADVEFLKPIDDLLENEAFVGFEDSTYVNSGQIFASVANNNLIKNHIALYDSISFYDIKNISEITCPRIFTKLLVDKGLKLNGSEQIIEGLQVYPNDYFNPFDTKTGKMIKTENSYSIHWSAHSWSNRNICIKKLVRVCHKLFGNDCFLKIKKNLRRFYFV